MEQSQNIRERAWRASPKAKTLWRAVIVLNFLGIVFLLIAAFVWPGISLAPYARIPLIVSGVSFVLYVLMVIGAFQSFRLGKIAAIVYTIAQLFNSNILFVAAGGFYIWAFHQLSKYAASPPILPSQAPAVQRPAVPKFIRFFVVPIGLVGLSIIFSYVGGRYAATHLSNSDEGGQAVGFALFLLFYIFGSLIASEVLGFANPTKVTYKKGVIILAVIVTLLGLTFLLPNFS